MSHGLAMGTESPNGNTAKAIAYYRHHNRTNGIPVVTISTACSTILNNKHAGDHQHAPGTTTQQLQATPTPTATGLQPLMALAVNIRTTTTTVDQSIARQHNM
jgi:hypothetical protein